MKSKRTTARVAVTISGLCSVFAIVPATAAHADVVSTPTTTLSAQETAAITAALNAETTIYRTLDTTPQPGDDQETSNVRALVAGLLAQGLTPATADSTYTITSVTRTLSSTAVNLVKRTSLTWLNPATGAPTDSSYDTNLNLTMASTNSSNDGGGDLYKPVVQTALDTAGAQTVLSAPDAEVLDAGLVKSLAAQPPVAEPTINKADTSAYVDLVNSKIPASEKNNVDTAGNTGSFSPPPGMNYQREVAYAKKWANSNDSKYPHGGDDCTYFASSVLHEGGWPTVGGGVYYHNDDSLWDYDMRSTGVDTYSWGSARHLEVFSRRSNRTAWLDNIWNGQIGDLLFEDWDPNGQADGHIDHAQVYTARDSNGMPYMAASRGVV